MDKWQHLFTHGEYAPPETILSGLTLEQVTQVPSNETHSIYDELWHLVRWQRIIVFRDETLYEAWCSGEAYPPIPPSSNQEWQALVDTFFEGLEEALAWTRSPEKLGHETDPGITMADNLTSLAVHNAYHFGKIVTLRQVMGVWSPKLVKAEASG
ncbi:MAG: DinB family protein [Trueperaceae bacterium]|nr:DinB family protein [Trueperaceae bacterium]